MILILYLGHEYVEVGLDGFLVGSGYGEYHLAVAGDGIVQLATVK